MTQTFRSRDERVTELEGYLESGIAFKFVSDEATSQIKEAEARGAAEERAKKADEDSASLRENALLRTAMSTVASYAGGYAEPTCSVEFLARAVPEEVRLRFKTLEARIAELEAEVVKLSDGIRNPDDVTCALMDSQYVAGAKFGWNCAQDDDHDSLAKMIERRLRDRIEAGVSFSDRSREARAALKREGGV